jgi:4-diphosphocytidyl-2-C-methyl-D-erythritol kinase
MLPITELAKAKINLYLHILGRRLDGYHELSSSVAFVDVADVVTIVPAQVNKLEVSGLFAGDVPMGETNSIWKSYSWLAARMALPAVQVTLEKNLPVASGIGGGSADAAAVLRGLLRLVGKTLSEDEVAGLATDLGADVPVCFRSKACLMQGIGEKISALTIDLPKALVLVNPLVPCSTAAVFAGMALQVGQAFRGSDELWRNDMIAAALKVQPAIGDVLSALNATSLSRCLMSGSGATCFGVAQSFHEAEVAADKLKQAHPTWWVKAAAVVT